MHLTRLPHSIAVASVEGYEAVINLGFLLEFALCRCLSGTELMMIYSEY